MASKLPPKAMNMPRHAVCAGAIPKVYLREEGISPYASTWFSYGKRSLSMHKGFMLLSIFSCYFTSTLILVPAILQITICSVVLILTAPALATEVPRSLPLTE